MNEKDKQENAQEEENVKANENSREKTWIGLVLIILIIFLTFILNP